MPLLTFLLTSLELVPCIRKEKQVLLNVFLFEALQKKCFF